VPIPEWSYTILRRHQLPGQPQEVRASNRTPLCLTDRASRGPGKQASILLTPRQTAHWSNSARQLKCHRLHKIVCQRLPAFRMSNKTYPCCSPIKNAKSRQPLIASTRYHRDQIPQTSNLNHSHDRAAFVAAKFNIVSLADRHNATAAVHNSQWNYAFKSLLVVSVLMDLKYFALLDLLVNELQSALFRKCT